MRFFFTLTIPPTLTTCLFHITNTLGESNNC